MSVRIVNSGVPISEKDVRECKEKLELDLALLAATLASLRMGDDSPLEPMREYILAKVRLLDASSMQAEIVMRMSFMKDGIKYFANKLNEIEKAGEN